MQVPGFCIYNPLRSTRTRADAFTRYPHFTSDAMLASLPASCSETMERCGTEIGEALPSEDGQCSMHPERYRDFHLKIGTFASLREQGLRQEKILEGFYHATTSDVSKQSHTGQRACPVRFIANAGQMVIADEDAQNAISDKHTGTERRPDEEPRICSPTHPEYIVWTLVGTSAASFSYVDQLLL